jgi:CheY-like chemotaxis protein
MTQPERLSSGTNYHLVFESAPWPCLILRPDLTIASASEAYLQAAELERAVIINRPLLQVFPKPADDPAGGTACNLKSSLERVLQTRQPDSVALENHGGRARSWKLVSSPVLDPSGAIAYIVHRIDDVIDLAQLKRAGREHSRMTRRLVLRLQAMEHEMSERTQLLKEANERLSAAPIGPREDVMRRLAGGVAHDFNDLMTVIAGSLSVIEDFAGSPADLRPLTAAMQRAIERGARLTSQLLTVGRDLTALSDPMVLKNLLADFSIPSVAHAVSEPLAGDHASARGLGEAVPAETARARGVIGRCGRILVVEDDPDVLTAVRGTVERLGYGTITARDGQEALAMLGGPEPLDLLFTDIVMPRGMNGIQLARRARELRPDLPVLLTSGYGFHVLSDGQNDGFPVLQKPYPRDALAERLRDLIGS